MGVTTDRDSAPYVLDIRAQRWCTVLRRVGLQRPWDLIFPPNRLYARGTAFNVGTDVRHCVLMKDGRAEAMFVLAMREGDCCLIDVRCQPDAYDSWADAMIDHWQAMGREYGAKALIGPVGAFAFLTDGVAESNAHAIDSIHIPYYPEILVASLRRRGYVHAWSGAIWGRERAVGTAPKNVARQTSSVRMGSWMNVISIARELENVLSTSFSTLPWHRGSGAGLSSLVRAYAPIFTPHLLLLGKAHNKVDVAGAVMMHKDIGSIPNLVLRLPRMFQILWLRYRASTSQCIHASVIGLVPSARNSRAGSQLFDETRSVFDGASRVTTSFIRDENIPSRMMARKAGLSPLQQRFVFRLVCQSCSTREGE